MIGVICAMSEERDALLKLMSDVKKRKFKKFLYHGYELDNTYYEGKIGSKKVALFHSGVGKVYSAIVTSQVVESVKPDLVINMGCAGSTNKKVHVNHIVCANRVAYWDVEVPGWDRSIQSDKISYACDGKFVKLFKNLKTKEKIHIGPIVSSDAFVYKKSQVNTIKKYFNTALCADMEGAAIANTCYAYGIDVAIIRSISDEALINGNYKKFDFNLHKVCDTVASLCAEIIKKY